MPKAYVIFKEVINDPEGMQAYAQAAMPTIADGAATVLAYDPAAEALEGKWSATQTVVMEFESVDAARAWYSSEAYQAAAKLRHAAADTDVVLISGF